MKKTVFVFAVLLISGCLGMPSEVKPVQNFDINRYMGNWYEIARLDHSFERGLSKVTAQYSLKDDGGVKVINRGFNAQLNEWKEAQGKAYFVRDSDQGYLKVSFFGPFYGSYVVFELEKDNYDYAFVSGPDNEYLWLLARSNTVEQAVIDKFISMSNERGFDTSRLIFVEH
ncbi:lipocalin family protein [Vibrio neptunius]|uniref:Outer membrane lipoprotein Blc n=1 Tax=Vibrio neptunius TaxID=170651 RepID=A0ABS3A616_9VIBR|nr:lipocalin family protein [Vibrio neptunius]MBN3494638.1 lipocalin family protein [Vibrio neptunius]MBN3517056.1 lipocalin family protein [Vibrio neptunius]MBN3551487.1 lipocalin family protein [Vibrio neptunius]MBN3579450.1 lipocalin family protein [Vibrio neptunius]MCH9873114.1 lipocalin family protein [Vibrio neptunius]